MSETFNEKLAILKRKTERLHHTAWTKRRNKRYTIKLTKYTIYNLTT